MKLKRFVVALLLIPLFVPAAWAAFLQGSDIPAAYDGQTLYALAAASGPSAPPTVDPGGPVKRYLSDGSKDYVLMPGNDPERMYALGDTASGPQAVAIPAPSTIPADALSPAGTPKVPYGTSIAARISSAMALPSSPGAGQSMHAPAISPLQHTDAALRGYDVSKIGNIVMPLVPVPSVRSGESPGIATATGGTPGPSSVPAGDPPAAQNSGPVKVEDAYCHDEEFRYALVNTLDHPVEMHYRWHLDNEYSGKQLYSGSRNVSLPAGGRVEIVEAFTPLYFSDPRFFVMCIEDDAGLIKYAGRKSPLEWDYGTRPPVRNR